MTDKNRIDDAKLKGIAGGADLGTSDLAVDPPGGGGGGSSIGRAPSAGTPTPGGPGPGGESTGGTGDGANQDFG